MVDMAELAARAAVSQSLPTVAVLAWPPAQRIRTCFFLAFVMAAFIALSAGAPD